MAIPPVAVGGRRGVALHQPLLEVHQPHFADLGPRIQRQLGPAVVSNGDALHLDEQEDIIRTEVGLGVEIVTRFEQGDVGDRLVEIVQSHRVLHVDNPGTVRQAGEDGGDAVDSRCVQAPYRTSSIT